MLTEGLGCMGVGRSGLWAELIELGLVEPDDELVIREMRAAPC